MDRTKLYLLLSCATAAGYAYFTWALFNHTGRPAFTPCAIKNITGIACPSCGSTRSVISLAQGHFTEAALINPMGIIVAAFMVMLPLWLAYDIALKKDSLYRSYKIIEEKLRQKWVAVILTALVLANWIWNINKGL